MAVRHSAAYAVYGKEDDVVRAARGLRKGLKRIYLLKKKMLQIIVRYVISIHKS